MAHQTERLCRHRLRCLLRYLLRYKLSSSAVSELYNLAQPSVYNSIHKKIFSRVLFLPSALCCDEEISGFDKLTGKTWIYPTNYPVRDYQFNIIKATILQNTLVSLPTGLGKTFIAAVIMYNFYRWYPLGKIVFTAPTRPLVAQQIDACYNIIGIPPGDTIEMTGHMQVAARKTHWKDKRVFFATPQVVYHDLKSGICPAERIRCLVFDEAHRARGNYAYCQIITTLNDMGYRTYRVLALSATPGSKVDDVINVVRNLQIANLELRTESCIDVVQYSHVKKINTVVVPLGAELTQLRRNYVEILDKYARRLKQLNILSRNLGNLSKGRIVMLYKEFQSRERNARHPQHNLIMKDFTVLISLYHGLELLVKHGARVFLNFFDEHTEKTWIQADDQLVGLLERLRDDLGVNPLGLDRSTLPDGTVAEIPQDISFGHPKFDHLRKIMMQHFESAQEKGQDTKAIVFCEYRESVNLVHCLLLQCRPLIKPQMFVGQGASGKEGGPAVSQKQQLRVMRGFREGTSNALIATCVAEEGLDVGSVDLIVCFDISTRSPIRLVQRCGRTGRERGGQVYILVTEGREHQTLQDCMRQRDNLNSRILQSHDVQAGLYGLNPRMFPRDLTPTVQKMYITVQKKLDPKDKRHKNKQGQKDLRTMLTSSKSKSDGIITRDEFAAMCPDGLPEVDYFDEPTEYWNLSREELKSVSEQDGSSKPKLSEWLEWQRKLQNTVKIDHSSDARVLSDLLQYADAKRFELQPSTQNPAYNTEVMNTQPLRLPSVPKKRPPVVKKKSKTIMENIRKDGDIRALFSTTKKSTKEYTKVVNELGIENAANIPTSLLDLMVDLSVNKESKRKCLSCKIIDCKYLEKLTKKKKIPAPLSILNGLDLPDLNLLDNIDVESIKKLHKEESNEDIFNYECLITDSVYENDVKASGNFDCSNNFDLAFDFDLVGSDLEDNENKKETSNENNFDVGNIEDIFIDHSPIETEKVEDRNKSDSKEALEFFGLKSLDDIFADSNDSVEIVENSPIYNSSDVTEAKKNKIVMEENNSKNNYGQHSPSLLSNSRIINDTIICSPIVCTQKRRFSLSTNTNPEKCSTPFPFEVSQKTLNMKPKSLFDNNTLHNDNIIDLAKSMDWSTQDWSKNETSTSRHCFHLENEPTTSRQHLNLENESSSSRQHFNQENERILARQSHNLETKHSASKERDTNNTVQQSGSKTMFSITQILNMINKSKDISKKYDNSEIDKSVSNLTNGSYTNAKGDNDRSSSPIIFSQGNKKTSKFNTSQNHKNNSNEAVNTFDPIQNHNDRSSSPILFSQATKKKSANANTSINKTKESLVILDSDSDSDGTVVYGLNPEENDLKVKSPEIYESENQSNKRKFNNSADESMFCSPYFNKRPKLENHTNKTSLSLKNKLKNIFPNTINKTFEPPDHYGVNFASTNPTIMSQRKFKENRKPDEFDFDEWFSPQKLLTQVSPQKNTLEKLQMFKRDTNKSKVRNINGILVKLSQDKNSDKPVSNAFSDSDEDFIVKTPRHQKKHSKEDGPAVNYKVRKKRNPKKVCEFLALEASQSDDAGSISGDELVSEDSEEGSIADFICDEPGEADDTTVGVDMQAHYLISVKSPVKGMFKIPELPRRYDNIYSQVDPNDNDYEMDSFCVDVDMGLTQAVDVSELELAEQRLEKKRRAKRKRQRVVVSTSATETTESPVAIVRNRRVRRISSESSGDSE